ncbi:hypothetical protein AcV7_001283 [Taiwanofungus camphoratus]|nr:hypothetical protein AcV7_001283 [Antrodia cinnamomea]
MRAKQGDNVMKAKGAAAVDGAGALATMKIMPRACADATHQWQRGPQRTANHMQARPRDCGYAVHATTVKSVWDVQNGSLNSVAGQLRQIGGETRGGRVVNGVSALVPCDGLVQMLTNDGERSQVTIMSVHKLTKIELCSLPIVNGERRTAHEAHCGGNRKRGRTWSKKRRGTPTSLYPHPQSADPIISIFRAPVRRNEQPPIANRERRERQAEVTAGSRGTSIGKGATKNGVWKGRTGDGSLHEGCSHTGPEEEQVKVIRLAARIHAQTRSPV